MCGAYTLLSAQTRDSCTGGFRWIRSTKSSSQENQSHHAVEQVAGYNVKLLVKSDGTATSKATDRPMLQSFTP